MTVHYTPKVPNARFLDFVRILIRWRGSVWKLVLPELCIWLTVYLIITLVYRFALTEDQRRVFESLTVSCNHSLRHIPITFILGFYVSFVMARWWYQYSNIGWADRFALATASWINGTDDQARLFRRGIVRYMLLYQLLVYRNISIRIRKIYPTIRSLFDAGYITPLELPFIEDTKFWLPVKWAFYLTRKARNLGLVTDRGVSYIYELLGGFRGDVIKLWLADWVPVPLVYTQVTLTCVRVFFLAATLSRQYLDVERTKKIAPIDAYVPFLEIIQFVCYIGWLKVAEVLVNPFGEDDTDFETYLIVKRNLAFAMQAADENISWMPVLRRDMFWDEKMPMMLYTKETANIEQHPNIGSAALQERRASRNVQMVQRIERPSSVTSMHTYFNLAETKGIRPIVDNSFEFFPSDSTDDLANSGLTTGTDGKSRTESDDVPRWVNRIASKENQLAAVKEVDEFNYEPSKDWSEEYLDSPAVEPGVQRNHH